jgi:hypothetical protein
MKKLFFLYFLGFVLFFSCNKEAESNVLNETQAPIRKADRVASVDIHISTVDGCDVHIVGDVTYTLIPPEITGFSGTVTVTGPPCDNVTLNFGISSNGSHDINLTLSSKGLCELEYIVFETSSKLVEQQVLDALNNVDNNFLLIDEIKSTQCD